jgi:hypothetical protein
MIISLKLDGGKHANPKIRELLDKKLWGKIRPRMSKRRKPTPKKEIKTSYRIKTKNIASIFLNWLENNAHKFDCELPTTKRYRVLVVASTDPN